MKVLFAHDHIFYKIKNIIYSTGGLSKEMLERYTKVFDRVQVISRQTELTETYDNLTKSSTKNVEFTSIPNFKSLKFLKKIFKAKSIIEEEVKKSDAIIARLPSSIGNISVQMAKKNNVPYLIEVVSCPWDSLWNHSNAGKISAPFSYYKMKKNVRESKYTIYVTEEFLQHRYPTNGEYTNCSNVALQKFDDNILKKRKEKIYIMNSEKPIIIGTTGAVNVKFKGQQFVIKALGKLKEEGYTNYEYHLVGGGNQNYLKAIAIKYNVANQVKFLGTMPHNKIFEWLETIDLYAQPSKQEGLPRALIEAMSNGLPSFGARTAGIPELLDSNYIFSNTKKNINEIIYILKSFNKETMMEQSSRNYEESKKFDKKIIETRRKDFLEEFKKTISLSN